MAAVLNDESIEKKLKAVINTQDSIQGLSLWVIHHKANHAKIVELWIKVLKNTADPLHRLTLFYLCNDVVQTCKKKNAHVYNTSFKEHLREAASLVRDLTVKGKVERIFNIWEERFVYDSAFTQSLHRILNGENVEVSKNQEEETKNAPSSPENSPFADFNLDQEANELPASEDNSQMDEEESARILAEFKPHEMIDQITAVKWQETEIEFKVNQLPPLKLDPSSLEAMKQLKDRVHGNEFSNQFEDFRLKLDDLIKRQTRHLQDQKELIETLNLSETFYDEQFREARIVANAYRNFGNRVNNMKKKLDELKKNLADLESPERSPEPPPSLSPPKTIGSAFSYNPDSPAHYSQQKSGEFGGAGTALGISASNAEDSNSFQDSTRELSSPEDSPADVNMDEPVKLSLESRLTQIFDDTGSDSENSQADKLPHSAASTSNVEVGEEESTMMSDDEAPTTPLQDEHLTSPPKQNTSPKKETPIDFLSRLISQNQKSPVKTDTQCFLDSLTMLTMTGKKTESDNASAWKIKSHDNNLSPLQPSPLTTYVPSTNLPSSPKQFPPVSAPVPVSPPVPLRTGMSIPIPAPPTIPIDFSTPPPGFQQTSPGQKENWPDMKHSQTVDHIGSSRGAQSSVLKELVQTEGEHVTSSKSAHGSVLKEFGPTKGEHSDHSSVLKEHAVSSRTVHSSALKELVPAEGEHAVSSRADHSSLKELVSAKEEIASYKAAQSSVLKELASADEEHTVSSRTTHSSVFKEVASVKGEYAVSSRAAHNSVLKELASADEEHAVSSRTAHSSVLKGLASANGEHAVSTSRAAHNSVLKELASAEGEHAVSTSRAAHNSFLKELASGEGEHAVSCRAAHSSVLKELMPTEDKHAAISKTAHSSIPKELVPAEGKYDTSSRGAHISVLKELIPDEGEHATSSRAAHSSALKELVSAERSRVNYGYHGQTSESELEEEAGILDHEFKWTRNVEPASEAKVEFAQKLKQKTSHVAIKSHVFVPNPARPNLMTLTVSDDMAGGDTDLMKEQAAPKSDRSSKSGHRSRSRSRERDRPHKRKKKVKYNYSEDEDRYLSDDENKSDARVGGVVKKTESHGSRRSRDHSKGEKYEKHDKYNDYRKHDSKKYDRHGDRRGHSERANYGSFNSSRDSVEAYAQAYKNAFLQQYAQHFKSFFTDPSSVDSWKPGYGN